MSFNTFGHVLRVTTWGESHGLAIGAVVDGCPPGLALSEADIQPWLDKRRPGASRFTTQRRESDSVRILSGTFEVTLWENRTGRPRLREVHRAGESNPLFLVVPPGVVHAYKNVGESDGFVLNFPNRLYAGRGKKEPVDEIRHEDGESEFRL